MATSASTPNAEHDHNSTSSKSGTGQGTAKQTHGNNEKTITSSRGWRFWAIFVALCVTSLLSSFEATVVSTALSTIVRDLNIRSSYPWAVNAYLLTSTCFQPNFGQLADFFGRRSVTLFAVATFVLGSGISGGAANESMLISGRAIQGVGGGGLNVMVDLIICDLVPLRERPKFIGIMSAMSAVGTSMGPFIGGSLVQHSSWRWIFYINLPIGGVAIVMLWAFLHVNCETQPLKQSLRRFDVIGSFLSIPSTAAILFALTYGGTMYPWSSWRAIVPLVLGLVGLIFFHIYEASDHPHDPLIPPRLFRNRTSAVAFFATFIHTLIFVWIIYFLPIYFQSVLQSTPARSGVQLLPTVTVMIPVGVATAVFTEKVGRYKPVHFVGLGLMALGTGLFALLDANSSMGMWVGLQIIATAGLGALVPALLPAAQADLSDEDSASSTATWAYIRSYGAVWGITIPVAIFNNEFSRHLDDITDLNIRGLLSDGNAYAYGNKAFISVLAATTRDQVIDAFTQSLKITWIVGAAVSAGTFLLVFLEKEIKLRTELDTKYALKEQSAKDKDSEKAKDGAGEAEPRTGTPSK